MSNWPSIVPAASEDFYIVINSYGRFGTVFAEPTLIAPTLRRPLPT